MKTAGVVLDFYDDLNGEILKSVYPDHKSLPESIKTAHILSVPERDILRDEAYALTMVNDGKIFRKFACVDPGNTMMSMAYFEKTASRLPQEAVDMAGINLFGFCAQYNIKPTDFVEKTAKKAIQGSEAASGMKRNRDSMNQPLVGDDADWASRTNLSSLRGGGDLGRVIPTANQMKTAGVMNKVLSTPLLEGAAMGGIAYGTGKVYDKLTSKNKKAEMLGGGETLTNDKRDVGVHSPTIAIQSKTPSSEGSGTPTVHPGPHPVVTGIVDVTGKKAAHKFQKKSSARYALGNKYPLDNYADVSKAVEYFSDNCLEMEPRDRHEYCVKTAARAEELGIDITPLMSRYGSTEYATDIEAHIASRQSLGGQEWEGVYDELLEKRASVSPDEFANMMYSVDKVAGLDRHWDGHLADPWRATFGGMSQKQKTAAWSWKSNTGDMVSHDQLQRLARDGKGILHKNFSKEIVDGFMKDPVIIFESLPETSKKILCNMANGEFDGPSTN